MTATVLISGVLPHAEEGKKTCAIIMLSQHKTTRQGLKNQLMLIIERILSTQVRLPFYFCTT